MLSETNTIQQRLHPLNNQNISIDLFLHAVKEKFSTKEICISVQPGEKWQKATLPWKSQPLAVLAPKLRKNFLRSWSIWVTMDVSMH